MRWVEMRRHTLRLIPGQHLSQAGVDLARQIGNTMGPFNRVITSHMPRAYETAIAMGFAVEHQLELLATFDPAVEAEVAWDAGFAAFAAAVQAEGAAARQAHRLAEYVRSVAATLPAGGAALIITHGGIIEAAAVACLPAADHAAWGRCCDYCEGIRLTFDGQRCVDGTILRIGGEQV